MSPEELDQRTGDVFVVSRAFKRVTYPRYALLDHVPFDAALRRQFGDVMIEDAWRPYFAVATVLDGSGEGLHLMRRGPLWKAVRASGSIPAVLPPVLTDDGRMLVDGAVIDNIPLRSMKALKAGPNLVVHFGERGTPQRFAADDASIPGRWSLMRQMLTPLRAAQFVQDAEPDWRHPAVSWSCTRHLNCCHSVRSISCWRFRCLPVRISWISIATRKCSRLPINGAAGRSTSCSTRATLRSPRFLPRRIEPRCHKASANQN